MENCVFNVDNIGDIDFIKKMFAFQSEMLVHMHDDKKVLMDIIIQNVHADKSALYICRESGYVEKMVFTANEENVVKSEIPLDIGLSEIFSTERRIIRANDNVSISLNYELESTFGGMSETTIIFSGKVDKILYGIILCVNKKNIDLIANNTAKFIVDNIRVVLENKILTEKIVYESEHDKLTGLLNRRCYFRRCQEEYGMLASVGIFFMDVNNLKVVNDKYGHDAGDALLKRAAESIKAMVCDNIHGYRMGGDEFIMVAINCTAADIQDIKKRWQNELDKVNAKYGMEPCVVAVGEAFGKGAFEIEELCKLADDRMYEDKKKKHGGMGR